MNIFQRRALNRDMEKFSPITGSSDSIIENEKNSDQNIFQKQAIKNIEKENQKFTFLETAKDVGEQVIAKGVSGFGGAYGNIQQTLKLAPEKSDQVQPAQKEIYTQQNEVFEKLDRGEIPSFTELMSLSDEDLVPRGSRLPTSKDIQKKTEELTGIGEGKTPIGRIAGRGTEFVSEGLAIPGGGVKGLISLGASGAAGQTIREAGGPESLASGVEIGGSILPTVISGKLKPSSKAAQDITEAGRNIGLTERQITPLIQSERKSAVVSKLARKGTKTKELFRSIKESLGDSYQNIKASVSNLGNVNNANRTILETRFKNIRNDLAKTLQASPEKEAAIKFIDGALEKLSKNGTSPEELINFWQDINKSVNWNSLQGGKKSLSRLKEPILEVLNNVAPAAAKDFELTNQLYSKYSQISKRLKPEIVDSFINKGEIASTIPAALSFVYGNPAPLLGLGGEVAVRLLSREMLINPYFQNIANKLVKNFNQGSIKAINETMKQAREYMERKHPNEKWEFLTEISED